MSGFLSLDSFSWTVYITTGTTLFCCLNFEHKRKRTLCKRFWKEIQNFSPTKISSPYSRTNHIHVYTCTTTHGSIPPDDRIREKLLSDEPSSFCPHVLSWISSASGVLSREPDETQVFVCMYALYHDNTRGRREDSPSLRVSRLCDH